MVNVKLNVLKPGLLVALNTNVHGGVSYVREDLDRKEEEGAKVQTWKTEKRVINADEFERATVARSKARSVIASVCSSSSFGLLCPQANEEKLDAAISEAKAIAAAHNDTAFHTKVDVFVIVGRIAQSDEEAAKAIANEVKGLLDQMKAATLKGDVEAIRQAANKARELGQILSEDAGQAVSKAIEEARKNARELVARVQKKGEKVADVVRDLYIQKIDSARSAFLDLEEGSVQKVEHVAPAVEV